MDFDVICEHYNKSKFDFVKHRNRNFIHIWLNETWMVADIGHLAPNAANATVRQNAAQNAANATEFVSSHLQRFCTAYVAFAAFLSH